MSAAFVRYDGAMRPLVPLLLASAAVASCDGDYTAQQTTAVSIAQAIVAACPLAAPDDAAARQQCADRLTAMTALRDVMGEPFRWGQQAQLWRYDLADSKTTNFNPRVFRRMYLSLFMFTGAYTMDQSGDLTVVHLPYQFRNGLDPGAYPYPFWHNPSKWRDYQLATEMHLVFRDGRMVGALRSAVRLNWRPATVRTWDGQWNWADGGEPRVSLYRNLFSPTNPYIDRVDEAYRALEGAMRPYNCLACHRPDNAAQSNPLELFSYPNQALVARHAIRQQLEQNRMPPNTGITDDAERQQLLGLARAFEAAADQALDAESEPDPARDLDAGR